MRHDKGQTPSVAAKRDQIRLVWSAPRLTVVPIDELTKGVDGPNFDADASPQS